MNLKKLFYSEYDLQENKSSNMETIINPSVKLTFEKIRALKFDSLNQITLLFDSELIVYGKFHVGSCAEKRLCIDFTIIWIDKKGGEIEFRGTLLDPNLVDANYMSKLYDAINYGTDEEYDEINEKYTIETSDPARLITIDMTVEEEYGWSVCEHFILNGKLPSYVTFWTRQDKLPDYQKFRDYWVESN